MKEEIKNIQIRDLKLDKENPRLGDFFEKIDHLEKLLIERYEVFKLVESINKDGWVTDRNIVVLKTHNGYKVLEGNRRVLACKILYDFDGYKKKYNSLIKNLVINKENIQTSIPCVIYTTREKAEKLIAKIHTKEDIKKWSIVSQGKFYINQLNNNNNNIKDLKYKFNVSLQKIKKIVILARLFFYIKDELGLTGKEKKDFSDRVEVISTLEKILANKAFKDFHEVNLDDFGNLQIIDKGKFKKWMKKRINDITDGKINTRSFSAWKDINAIKKFVSMGQISEILVPEQSSNKTKLKNCNLSSDHSITEPKQPKLKKLFEALDRIPKNQHNILFFIGYMVLFENTLRKYLDKKGIIKELKEKKAQEIKNNYKAKEKTDIPKNQLDKQVQKYEPLFNEMLDIYIKSLQGNERTRLTQVKKDLLTEYNLSKHDFNFTVSKDNVDTIINNTAYILDDMIKEINKNENTT